jgi:hypothetical protein
MILVVPFIIITTLEKLPHFHQHAWLVALSRAVGPRLAAVGLVLAGQRHRSLSPPAEGSGAGSSRPAIVLFAYGRMLMREIGYVVRGFLTVRRDSLRVPLRGSLTVNADPDSGLFSGDLALHQSTINRALLGVSLFSATVQIEAESPVIGRVDPEGRMFAAVSVDAVIANVHAAGRALIRDDSCRTAMHAVVPLRSKPGFDLERGGRLVGRYHRPPFTGCGWLTPFVNLLVAGPGNAVVIDLIPDTL